MTTAGQSHSASALSNQLPAHCLCLQGQDHCPTLLSMTQGSGAGALHGSSGPGFDPMQYYVWKDRQMHNGLVVVTWQLVDHPVGAGGLVRAA